MVSNSAQKSTSMAHDEQLRLLNLQSNFLWHTDSTFLPVPALANILTAKVISSSGGETELVSTRAGWSRLSSALKDKLRDAVFLHRYAHSRAKISPELAKEELFTMWPDQAWRAVWRNPVTGDEALYIASHVYGVRGMAQEDAAALIDELTAAMTRPEDIYTHMHRGRPWPYAEERSLASFCVSASPADGLEEMRA